MCVEQNAADLNIETSRNLVHLLSPLLLLAPLHQSRSRPLVPGQRVLHVQKQKILHTTIFSVCMQGSDAIGTWDSQRPSSTLFMAGLSCGRGPPGSDSDEEEVVESRLRIHSVPNPTPATAAKMELPGSLADVSHKTAGLDLEGTPGLWGLSSEHPGQTKPNTRASRLKCPSWHPFPTAVLRRPPYVCIHLRCSLTP